MSLKMAEQWKKANSTSYKDSETMTRQYKMKNKDKRKTSIKTMARERNKPMK